MTELCMFVWESISLEIKAISRYTAIQNFRYINIAVIRKLGIFNTNANVSATINENNNEKKMKESNCQNYFDQGYLFI